MCASLVTMSHRSKRNRRVPPRGNPDEGQQAEQQFTTGKPQTATIPWATLIITTGLTTMTGYVFLEVIRSAHRYVKGRKEAKLAALNPPADQAPPGTLANGAFQLPLPDGAAVPDFSGPGHGGFGAIRRPPMPGDPMQGRPPMTEVSTPLGELRHQVGQYQYNVDSRLDRIERLLQQHYGETG